MISILSLILNLIRRERIIQVRRMPPTKALRAHILGLTLGIVLVLLTIIADFYSLFIGLPWFVPLVQFVLFALGTAAGAPFVILTGVLCFMSVSSPIPGVAPSFFETFHILAEWYFLGYVIGVIFATFYNDLVYLHLLLFDKDLVKIAFAVDPQRVINVIKSPIASEEIAMNQLPADFRDRRVYRYRLDSAPTHPYTVAFVANPRILKVDGDPSVPGDYEPDPIIADYELFLREVDRALFSFESDEVVGRPEIYSRMRILTVFDQSLASTRTNGVVHGLAQEYRDGLEIGGRVIDNLIDSVADAPEKVRQSIDNHKAASGLPTFDPGEIDVIYIMTASPTHDRSSARYSDTRHDEPVVPVDDCGCVFKFDPDPFATKGNEITAQSCNGTLACRHEFYATVPGRVTLNVISARDKTFIHEFAHAMSSGLRGAVLDEYADQFNLTNPEAREANNAPQFYVNRIERNLNLPDNLIPVHKLFARYRDVDYYSDLNHPSAEESWVGYFPEKHCCTQPCTMDRSFGFSRFDKLISAFIYDRLTAKINRTTPPPVHP